MKPLIIFFLLCCTAFASEEWFYPKVYKGIIFACISEKTSDETMDRMNLDLSDPEIQFINCPIQEEETEK